MGTRLYVGNLSYDTTKAALETAFATGGRTVKDCHLPEDRETGRPRGFAFVEMSSDAEAQEVIDEWDGKSLDGRNLKVNEAKPRENRGGGGGGGGGGRRDREHYSGGGGDRW